ncbi:MAG: hypothetical protein E6P95_01785 [Candidatus Moraniibacteriota bacterium]|nr:MAG: hypothetical protein E6P95_01785 [Candidatus Moranbacteria bacterium]
MGLESASKRVERYGVGLTGKVEHFSRSHEAADASTSLAEGIITEHDDERREELVSSLNMMLNEIGVPATYLEDLHEEQKDQVNRIVAGYLGAVIALDSQAKIRYKKELAQVLG